MNHTKKLTSASIAERNALIKDGMARAHLERSRAFHNLFSMWKPGR